MNNLLGSLFDDTENRPLTVSELNAEVRGVLERQFGSVWVEAEVTGFIAHSSGHWYFSLNDGKSQIKCVCSGDDVHYPRSVLMEILLDVRQPSVLPFDP